MNEMQQFYDNFLSEEKTGILKETAKRGCPGFDRGSLERSGSRVSHVRARMTHNRKQKTSNRLKGTHRGDLAPEPLMRS